MIGQSEVIEIISGPSYLKNTELKNFAKMLAKWIV